MPHFSGHQRQRDGDSSLLLWVLGNLRSIGPEFCSTSSKIIGKKLLVQAAPELIDIATPKKTLKQASKINAILQFQKTIK